jgi:enoyl-CoA hydratase/carnithine racemase
MAVPIMKPVLIRHDEDAVARLVLNRPEARNALSVALLGALQRELDAIALDKEIRAVVIAGNGPAFCAGHDLKEMRANPDHESCEDLFRRCAAVMLSITRLPQPVIARVHGMATAAGCQLVATCDLAVAGPRARFATPGVNLGLFCSTPMVALSRAVGRKAAMEMLLTGTPIDGETALGFGLINRVVPEDALDDTVDALATTIAGKSSLAVSLGKEAFYRQLEMGLEEAYAHTSAVMTRNMLADDAAEGIDAFLEKRTPHWKGR